MGSEMCIRDRVGFSRQAIREFLDLLRNGENGTDAENPVLLENPELANEADREFDDDEQDDSNSLGIYKLDKRLLIKANHMDEYFKPPIYNVCKQQERSDQVNHFGNARSQTSHNVATHVLTQHAFQLCEIINL